MHFLGVVWVIFTYCYWIKRVHDMLHIYPSSKSPDARPQAVLNPGPLVGKSYHTTTPPHHAMSDHLTPTYIAQSLRKGSVETLMVLSI